MRVALLLFAAASAACVAPYEDTPMGSVVTHNNTTNVVVQQQVAQVQARSEPDYMSLFHDAGPIADPTPVDSTPKGISVEDTPVDPPRARVFVGGGGGNVIMNNVTIHGDVYIGSSPTVVVPHPPPTGATIQACEAYVDRVETCSVRMLGSGEASQRIVDSMEAARRTWRRFASDARVRDSLADSCTVARRQYDASAASYCHDG